MSHLTYTLLMAFLVSGATALPGKASDRDKCYRAVYVFAGCMISTMAGGWLMYLVHG